MTLIMNSKKPDYICRQAFNKILGMYFTVTHDRRDLCLLNNVCLSHELKIHNFSIILRSTHGKLLCRISCSMKVKLRLSKLSIVRGGNVQMEERDHSFTILSLTSMFSCITDILASDQTINAVIGLLGMLRLLIPELTTTKNCDFFKITQILDVCLHLLHDKSHSIINASLEVIHVILRCSHQILKKLLTSTDHVDVIRQDDSLRNLIFKKSGSKSTSSKMNEIDKHYFEMHSSRELEGSLFSKDTQILDEGCLSCTDIEMDSLKSIDSTHDAENLKKKSDTVSLKSQKSTESFGSFFNTLLSQSKPTGKTISYLTVALPTIFVYLFCQKLSRNSFALKDRR